MEKDTLHIFEDADSNRYSWKTAARKLEVDEIYHLKGTIKEHIKKIDGAETVLERYNMEIISGDAVLLKSFVRML